MGTPHRRTTIDAELLDMHAAADLLGVSPRWVREQVATRRIRYVKVGRLVRFRRVDLLAYIDENTVEAHA